MPVHEALARLGYTLLSDHSRVELTEAYRKLAILLALNKNRLDILQGLNS